MNLPIADIWYGIEPVTDGIVRLREAHVDPYLSGEIWLVRGRDGDLAIDTGAGIVPPAPVIETITGRPAIGVALCYFFDHAGGLYSFGERACHAIDAQALADGRDAVEDYVCPEMVLLASVGHPLQEQAGNLSRRGEKGELPVMQRGNFVVNSRVYSIARIDDLQGIGDDPERREEPDVLARAVDDPIENIPVRLIAGGG